MSEQLLVDDASSQGSLSSTFAKYDVQLSENLTEYQDVQI